ATSSARFFASAFERVMPFGALSAPLYATRTCCAAMASGTVAGVAEEAEAEAASGAEPAVDALAAALGTSVAGLIFGLSSQALATAAIARPITTTDQLDFPRFSIGHAYYSSQDVGDKAAAKQQRGCVTEG
ncbi:MAG: hypothetical protein QOI41_6481, partial [Myxococcales bacterium]|nr:hypothetical protein [Myxococcales bacterium]